MEFKSINRPVQFYPHFVHRVKRFSSQVITDVLCSKPVIEPVPVAEGKRHTLADRTEGAPIRLTVLIDQGAGWDGPWDNWRKESGIIRSDAMASDRHSV